VLTSRLRREEKEDLSPEVNLKVKKEEEEENLSLRLTLRFKGITRPREPPRDPSPPSFNGITRPRQHPPDTPLWARAP